MIPQQQTRTAPPRTVLAAPPPGVRAEPPADAIADLISRAVATEVPRLVKAADHVQDLIDRLEEDLTEHERSAELRAEADRLEARLAEIRGQLGRVAPAAAARRRDAKEIREWAKATGVDCPQFGRIPKAVIDAYEQREGDA